MIRPARPEDEDALRSVCLRTGDLGRDATGRWSSDDLLPDIFLSPYLRSAPEWAWTVQSDAGTPIGYLLAVPDTRAFVDWWQREVTPTFAHPRLASDPDEQWLHDLGYEPERMIPRGVDLDLFPAHLHIDLLPEAQGSGMGRKLMRALGAKLVEAGVPGIHLGYDTANTGAGAFYDKLGWRPTADKPWVRVIEPERLL